MSILTFLLFYYILLSMKMNQRGFSVILIIACLLVVAGIATAGWYVHSSQKTAKGSQAAAAAVSDTIKGTKIHAGSYYTVGFKASGQYSGKATSINSTYFRLSPVYYYASPSSFVQLGQELHAPEPAMYVNASNVDSFKELSHSDTRYQGIQTLKQADGEPTVHDALPATNIDTYIKHAQYQAVFFADGKVYFGKLRSVASNPVFDDPTRVFELSTENDQRSLLNVKPTEISVYNRGQILFWENLKDDGQVAKAISAYLKQNP